MMVTVSILAILAAYAVPAMQRFVVTARINAIASDFTSSIAYARNEAISRSDRIVMCASTNFTSCVTSQFWGETGWIIFQDDNLNNIKDTAEEVIRAYGQVDASGGLYGLVRQTTGTYIRFNADGTTGQTTARFNVVVSSGTWPEKTICIAITGRARVVDNVGANPCN